MQRISIKISPAVKRRNDKAPTDADVLNQMKETHFRFCSHQPHKFTILNQSENKNTHDESPLKSLKAINIMTMSPATSFKPWTFRDKVVGKITNFGDIHHVKELDLSDFVETSSKNRKNLMHGRDVVTCFLLTVHR